MHAAVPGDRRATVTSGPGSPGAGPGEGGPNGGPAAGGEKKGGKEGGVIDAEFEETNG
jgi:hypothetical protein